MRNHDVSLLLTAMTLDQAHKINNYEPGSGFTRKLYYDGRRASTIKNPEDAVRKEAATQVNRRVGLGVGSALSK